MTTSESIQSAIPEDTLKLLLETGIMATNLGLFSRAEGIFNGILALRPECQTTLICLATTKLLSKRFDEAIKILKEKVLTKNPENDAAKSILGLVLQEAGLSQEGRTVLESVSAQDKESKALAEALLAP
tara:strand:+ start:15295 stop:15681 length:387 start_codon:yes stop_codon:yes gene_type:complete